jgi:Leucine-rich repeat (LRR) protein
VKFLPKSIEKLSNLVTLDVFNSYIQELPPGIVKLKNLRHLLLELTHTNTTDQRKLEMGEEKVQ